MGYRGYLFSHRGSSCASYLFGLGSNYRRMGGTDVVKLGGIGREYFSCVERVEGNPCINVYEILLV